MRLRVTADQWARGDRFEQACLVSCLPMPEREHRFHPSRKWRLDYAWPEEKVAVEVHGSVWTQGRHTRGQGFKKDREKMNSAQVMGWIVLETDTDGSTSVSFLRLLGDALARRSQCR